MIWQTSGRLLKSFTALSLARTDMVPSSLLYWMEEFFRHASSKSNIPVHWEKTIAFSPPILINSQELLFVESWHSGLPGRSSVDEALIDFSLAPTTASWGGLFLEEDSFGLDNDIRTSRAALILEDSYITDEEGSTESPTVEQELATELSSPSWSEWELHNEDLENNKDALRRTLHPAVGHWLSSLERCSKMHCLQKTWPHSETTASSGGSYRNNHRNLSKILADLLPDKGKISRITKGTLRYKHSVQIDQRRSKCVQEVLVTK